MTTHAAFLGTLPVFAPARARFAPREGCPLHSVQQLSGALLEIKATIVMDSTFRGRQQIDALLLGKLVWG